MDDTIYVDSNEPPWIHTKIKKEIEERAKYDYDVEKRQLKTGDIVCGPVCIERKTNSDFCSSITDQRLKDQATRMAKDFEHNYILFSGDLYEQSHSNLHDNSIAGMAISLSSKRNIKMVPYKEGSNIGYAALKIIDTHQSEETEDILLERTKADTEDVFTAQLSCIQGISQDKAMKLADELESWKRISLFISEDEEDLIKDIAQTVDGVGPTLSQRIVDAAKNTEDT